VVPRRIGAQRPAGSASVNARALGVVTLLSLGALLAGCGGGSDSSESTSTPSTSAASSTSSSTTVDTTSVTVGIVCSTPADAATSLVQAWTAGDQGAAARCASAEVVQQLFATSGAGNTWRDEGCDASNQPAPTCSYFYEGGGALLTASGSDAAGWKITKLTLVPD
jgi:hypothetical protein